ncbi:hypothetical protein CVT24_009571 [Panaeolus cyanescens]|uniref:Lipoyl-binding domain-containing protein n=1 Tax=Panaeolus cyanescens TaxID=181874 RepID=A0A409YAA5_9AGAR|nr:hypothetical protein CVT24_009571 [Panaeolus cyanescens]
MSSLALSKAPSAVPTRATYSRVRRRCLHSFLRRQSIVMPAVSPLMTKGTVTRWKKREGEAFAVGDVLLEIESDYATIDVQAEKPGIIGKILVPDGTTNVPIEQIIALVAKDPSELPMIQSALSLPPTLNHIAGPPAVPPYNPIPTPPSLSLKSPRVMDNSRIPLASPRSPSRSMSRSPRTPSLFEMHTMGYGSRSLHLASTHRSRLAHTRRDSTMAIEIPSPSSPRSDYIFSATLDTPSTAQWPRTAVTPLCSTPGEPEQVNAAAIRRMIVSNLASKPSKNWDLEELL